MQAVENATHAMKKGLTPSQPMDMSALFLYQNIFFGGGVGKQKVQIPIADDVVQILHIALQEGGGLVPLTAVAKQDTATGVLHHDVAYCYLLGVAIVVVAVGIDCLHGKEHPDGTSA